MVISPRYLRHSCAVPGGQADRGSRFGHGVYYASSRGIKQAYLSMCLRVDYSLNLHHPGGRVRD
jgi:hypothetical protein